MLHPLISKHKKPQTLNNPFDYLPHPLCIQAAEEVCRMVAAHSNWQQEVGNGKMFGVLIVEQNDSKQLAFLAAYSGQILGRSDWEGFVPAVFDYLQPHGYFKQEEQNISQLTREIGLKEKQSDYIAAKEAFYEVQKNMADDLAQYVAGMKEAKQQRDKRRLQRSITDGEAAQMTRESQFMRAELRRKKAAWNTQLSSLHALINSFEEDIRRLRKERKTRSDALQRWLFDHFMMLSYTGKTRSLTEIFAGTAMKTPPAGAGECCAPKLFQYAFLHHLRPVAIAEFWLGKSPDSIIRHEKQFYPACQGKCRPILEFMLSGIPIQTSPHIMPSNHAEACPSPPHTHDRSIPLHTVYEDESIIVIDKTHGLQSVPGRNGRPSVYSLLKDRLPEDAPPIMIHRLDMDTSGIMVIAKTREAHKNLQAQFIKRQVEKAYIALLDGVISPSNQAGHKVIDLPLAADYIHRPCQKVDIKEGKRAITEYRILEIKNGETRLELIPHTGRTHQLRVHCAHKDGIGIPIKGDRLYGKPADRLYLHAERMTFRHPVTGEKMTFRVQAGF